MTKIQNGRHFDVQTPKWQIVLFYSASNTYWSTLVSFDTRENLENQSGKFPNSKWPPFWRTCTKMANFNIIKCLTVQFCIIWHMKNSTNPKVENDQNSKWPVHVYIQNGCHFDMHASKWSIWSLYSPCNAYWCALESFNTGENSKKIKSAKWPNFKLAAILTYLHQKSGWGEVRTHGIRITHRMLEPAR